jgi:glycosyltransferase involved in cell wall biosynthesis
MRLRLVASILVLMKKKYPLTNNANSCPLSVAVFSQDPNRLTRELVVEISRKLGCCVFVAGKADLPNESAPNVEYIVAPSYRRNTIGMRISSWIIYALCALGKTLMLLNRIDLFIFVSSPPFIGILGPLVCVLGKKSYILIVYDIYPEIVENFGLIRRNGLVAKLWNYVNRRAYQHAAYIVTVSREMAQKIRDQMGKDCFEERIRVVPTWVDTAFIKPINKIDNSFAVQHGQKNKITVMYAGNLSNLADVGILPSVAHRFRGTEKVHFIVVGKGNKFQQLRRNIQNRGLENVTVLPYQPESVLPLMLASADISLVSVDSRVLNCSVPSKTYYNMAAGCAILAYCAKGDGLERIIDTYHCGFSCQDEEQIVDALNQFLNNEDFLNQCKKNSRQAAESVFEKDRCISMILELIEKVSLQRYFCS